MKKKKIVLTDLSSVFGRRRWLPIACHLFANVAIVDPKDRKFFLSLSEDRKNQNIWVPFGGESEYLNAEQFSETAAREASEESGLSINPKDLIFLDSRISYPTAKNSLGGIILVINSYIYVMKPEDPVPSIGAQISEDGCKIIDIKKFSFSELKSAVERKEVNVYSNFTETLENLEKWAKKNLKKED